MPVKTTVIEDVDCQNTVKSVNAERNFSAELRVVGSEKDVKVRAEKIAGDKKKAIKSGPKEEPAKEEAVKGEPVAEATK